MSARIDSAGNVYQLDRQATPDEVVTVNDVKDAEKLSRLLARLLRDVAGLKRRWWPQSIDVEDIPVASTKTTVRIPHNLNARVHGWVIGWTPTSTAANYVPLFSTSSASDLNTLVLSNVDITGIGRFAGKITVRIEVAG